jgi:hypothetical protein
MSCCSACGRHACACACGCGAGARTPRSLYNRPGLDILAYRVGSYTDFRATMQLDLSDAALPALAGLRTREPDDPSLALLDAWAVGADVLAHVVVFRAAAVAVDFSDHEPAVRLQGAPEVSQHLGRVIEVVVDLEDKRQVDLAFRQVGTVVGSQHGGDVGPLVGSDALLRLIEEVLRDVFRDDPAGRSHGFHQVRQPDPDAGADVRYRDARLDA